MNMDAISRLKQISENFEDQYNNVGVPLMILTSVDDTEIDFIRNHLQDIVNAYDRGEEWALLLLVYCIMDHIYEKYGAEVDQRANIWPLIDKYLSNFTQIKNNVLAEVISYVLEKYGFHIFEEGKKNQNTIIFNSTSIYYSKRFFDFIMRCYKDLAKDDEPDLEKLADEISNTFSPNDSRISTIGHSFGLLPLEKDIFREIFVEVITKIHQRINNELECDLGRWEEAFNEWYSDIKSAEYTASKAEYYLDYDDREYRFRIVFPSSRNITDKGYRIIINYGVENISLDVPVRKRAKVPSSQEYSYTFPPYFSDPLGKLRAADSASELFKLDRADYRFFKEDGHYAKSVSAGKYKVIIRKEIDYNLPELYKEDFTDDTVIISTELVRGQTYHIGSSEITLQQKTEKPHLHMYFPPAGDVIPIRTDFDAVTPCHPKLILDSDLENVSILIKNYAGITAFRKEFDKISGETDLNEFLPDSDSGIYSIRVSYGKFRLASKKYLLIRDLNYHLKETICMPSEGSIEYSASFGKGTLEYADKDMYLQQNGNESKWQVRTPNIFYNLHPSENEDDWLPAGSEFDINDLSSTISVSPGCIPDGEQLQLLLKSQLGTDVLEGIVDRGSCSFIIGPSISKVQDKKKEFTVELRYGEHLYFLFGRSALGSYDIDVCNGIAAVTPYRIPENCIIEYDYCSNDESDAGFLSLGQTALFDLNKPHIASVKETNRETNDSILIYEDQDPGVDKPDIDLDSLPELVVADHLFNGIGQHQDIQTALDIYHKLSEEGNADATLKLARIYMNGSGIHEDSKKASDLFHRYLDQTKVSANSDKNVATEQRTGSSEEQ